MRDPERITADQMISWVPTPSALNRTISARQTSGRCAARRRRSPGLRVMEIPVRMRQARSVISNQARFRNDKVTITGISTEWKRTAESGNVMTFHFCPTCGSTVFWENAGFPGLVSVAIGNFADPGFPAPTIAVWEKSRHPWLALPFDTPPKRSAKQG